MYIKYYLIRDFQSHQETEFAFSPGVNVITGPSDSGKTSIVRTFDYLFYGGHIPLDDYIRHNASCFEFHLTMDNGIKIVRRKGKNVNQYTVTDINGITQVYENTGIEVPKPIRDLLGIREVEYDVDKSLKINVSDQLDPLFLFFESSLSKAKVLGTLNGIHLVDWSLRSLNKDIKLCDDSNKAVEQDVVRFEKELEEFKNLDVYDSKIKEVEKLIKELEILEKKREELIILQQNYLDMITQLQQLNVYEKEVGKVNLVELTLSLYKYENLVSLYQSYKDCKNQLSTYTKCYSNLKVVDTKEFDNNIERFRILINMNNQIISKRQEYRSLVKQGNEIDSSLSFQISSYKTELLAQKKCPICGSIISLDIIDSCIKEL